MDFSFGEEQEMLKRTARDFLEKECPKSMVREMVEDEKGYSLEIWNKMAQLGWLGLVFPADYDGGDGDFLDLMVLCEEMGRALLPSPFFTTVILSGLYLLETGSDKQKRQYLPGLASGDVLLTLAFTEPSGDYDPGSIITSAVRQGDDYVLSGSKLFVPYAHVADSLLCVTRTQGVEGMAEGLTTFIVDARCPGVACNQLQTMAGDHQCEVVLDNVKVSGENIVGEVHNCWPQLQKALDMATVALCIDMIGGAQRVLEMTVEYSKNRVQFGRPIGSMQALQHHCANMAVSIEAAHSLAYEAAWKMSQGIPCRAEVSMAKSFTSECYTQTTQLAMLIHGGVGFMEDHDLPLYYRKAKATEVLLGDPDSHREMIAKEFLDES